MLEILAAARPFDVISVSSQPSTPHTAYNKNFQQTSQAKIIDRFMPQDVGASVVWHLWLVHWKS